MIFNPKREPGSIMVMVLILTVIAMVLAAIGLELLTREYTHSTRSSSWGESMFMAEAGIERGFYAINQVQLGATNAWSGWTSATNTHSMSNVQLTANATNTVLGYYDVTVLTTNGASGLTNYYITASGRVPLPDTAGQTVQRRVQIFVAPYNPYKFGILAKDSINFNGNNATVDSYDSSNSSKSTAGQYDVAKRQQNGDVATIGTTFQADLAFVYGDLYVGVNGTISGGSNVSGTKNYGLQVNIPDPRMNWTPAGTTLDGTTGWPTTAGTGAALWNGNATYGPGDYNVTAIDLNNKTVILNPSTGKIRIYISGVTVGHNVKGIDLSGSASIQIATNSYPVEIWTKGYMSLSGLGIISPANGTPSQLSIFGMTPTDGTSRSVTDTGNGGFKGTIYAPGFDATITGGGVVTGSLVAKTVTMTGTATFHYDEALNNAIPAAIGYDVVYWVELPPY